MQLVGAIGLAVLGIVFIVIGATSGGGVALGIGVAGLALGLMNLVQVLTRRSKGT